MVPPIALATLLSAGALVALCTAFGILVRRAGGPLVDAKLTILPGLVEGMRAWAEGPLTKSLRPASTWGPLARPPRRVAPSAT